MLSKENPDIKQAYDILQIMSKDKAERMAYEARQAEIMDQRTREKTAREAGKREGLEEGIAKVKKKLY